MKTISLIHRWAGGIIGLLLAVLGLSGSLLVWKDVWIRATVPGANVPIAPTAETLVTALKTIAAATENTPQYIIFPGNGIGVYTISTGGESGVYADKNGLIVESWNTLSERFELWLFDLHHHLLISDAGETISGIAGLIGLMFVVTGSILWWRTRKQFRLRALPDRMLRPAIIKHHRDIGIVAAPVMALIMLTGVMMALRPVAALVLSPLSSPQEMITAMTPPSFEPTDKRPSFEGVNWQKIINTAHDTFPTAEIRMVLLPNARSQLLSIRMKLPSEWLPNGRTLLWFNPATANLVEARNAETHPPGLKVYNTAYPLHAARIGGYIYKVIVTLVGLILTMLGSFAVWSFWRQQIKHGVQRKTPIT